MRRREFIAGLCGAATWPLTAEAQQPAMVVIGCLSGGTESGQARFTTAFREGLAEQGYVDGRNLEILYRWAEMRNDRLPALAADLVGRRVAAIVTTGGPAAHLAAKSATATIPIVFATGSNPVELGLVASLNRPGGNITGVTFLSVALVAKRLELLHEIVPTAKSIAHLLNPTSPDLGAQMRGAEAAALALGVHLVTLNASTPSEIQAAFGTLAGQPISAFMEGADPLFTEQRDRLVALTARHALPAVHHAREIVDAGGLMSYGARFSDAWRLAGTYVGRVLKGERPSELAVQQSTRIETVLNLETAKTLGLEVPTSILLRADEVIE